MSSEPTTTTNPPDYDLVVKVLGGTRSDFYSVEERGPEVREERAKIGERYRSLKSDGHSFQQAAEQAKREWLESFLSWRAAP